MDDDSLKKEDSHTRRFGDQKLLERIRMLESLLAEETSKRKEVQEQLEAVTSAYSRFVPPEFLKILDKKNVLELEPGDQVEKEMTVLFSDIRGFTALSEGMKPKENFTFINSYLKQMEPVIFRNNGIVDKYIGDAIMALFPHGADDGVQAGIDMLISLAEFNKGRTSLEQPPIRIGIGLNTGILMLGTVGGFNKMEGTVISDTVNLAARLETLTKTYQTPILISEHILFSLSDTSRFCIRFIDRVFVKGKSRPQSVYEVFNHEPPKIRDSKLRHRDKFEEALAYYHFREIDTAERLLNEYLVANPEDGPAEIYLQRCAIFKNSGRHISTGELDLVTQWKDDYDVGIEVIDKQHRELLDEINKLASAVGLDRGSEEVAEAMKFLEKYINVHFETEGQLMKKYDYPFIKEHFGQHETFGNYFQKLKRETEKPGQDRQFLLFRIHLLLVDWLINHSTKTDKHLGRFLRDRMN